MFEQIRTYPAALGEETPNLAEVISHIQASSKPTVSERLRQASDAGEILLQPRCGVGDHEQMKALHRQIYTRARPDVLSLTIDSHTRLLQLDKAREVAHTAPQRLNGYPLIAHGWRKGRELDAAIPIPLEVRHGSPDPRRLFDYTIAAGITSFEGGPIGYNLPYCRDVTIEDAWRYWDYVECACGELAGQGVDVDREIFGTLTGVLMPPSVSIAIAMIEAINAADKGVITLSIAIPQCGNPTQDVAQLWALRCVAARYLPLSAKFYTVLHQFMGVFPVERHRAESLILLGAIAARRGGANKVITKTYEESQGVPTGRANADGISLTRAGTDSMLTALDLYDAELDEETHFIIDDVSNLIEPVLHEPHLGRAVAKGFRDGRLDVPFSASSAARSNVIPIRDTRGFIRMHSYGRLPISDRSKRRNNRLIRQYTHREEAVRPIYARVKDAVMYFQDKSTETVS